MNGSYVPYAGTPAARHFPGQMPGSSPPPPSQMYQRPPQYATPDYGTPSPFGQPSQPWPQAQYHDQAPHHLQTIPQARPGPQSYSSGYAPSSDPRYIPQPYTSYNQAQPPYGLSPQFGTPPQQYSTSYPGHNAAFGEPFPRQPWPMSDPRSSMQQRSYSVASQQPHGGQHRHHHHHRHSYSHPTRPAMSSMGSSRSGYHDTNHNEMAFDSLYDSDEEEDEEERRRMKHERHKKRREEEARKREPERPTLGDTMVSIFGTVKSALGPRDKI